MSLNLSKNTLFEIKCRASFMFLPKPEPNTVDLKSILVELRSIQKSMQCSYQAAIYFDSKWLQFRISM